MESSSNRKVSKGMHKPNNIVTVPIDDDFFNGGAFSSGPL